MYTILFPYLLGLLLAAVTCYPARALGPRDERRFFVVILVVVAAGFVGFPLQQADLAGAIWEGLAMAILLALAWFGRRSPVWLAVAFFGHGAWDLAYLIGLVPVDKPVWVIQLCVPYDWVVASYLLSRLAVWRREVEAPAS